MATGKRYYWIKLKNTFMTSDAVDYLMGQPDGANYVVLYQMLCLKTINTGGKLERHIGEVIIPYDEAKIQRDCKWFPIDTVRVALNLYKNLGLIYTDKDGVLCLTDHENLIGSETDYASQKRAQRSNGPPMLPVDNVHTSVHTDIEIRDKEKELRDKSIDTEKRKSKKEKFTPPTLEEIKAYAAERNSAVDPVKFFEYYSAGNWIDGKGNPVQKFLTWERKDGPQSRNAPVSNDPKRYSDDFVKAISDLQNRKDST